MKAKAAAKKASRRPAAKVAAPRRVFTVRDLNRQPQAVLNAARKSGGVHVHSRSGERFILKLDPAAKSAVSDVEHRRAFHERLKLLHARMREAGSSGITEEGWGTFSKMIAGES
ncbi:MAG: hypothetical protein ACKVY0_11470 [Prosthecobacter sp.]|uniref:hypothetical protein n=1 Tax=Prosthecobacter sp. TaxID=1965333 RepID=UPI0038FFA202